jgi:hypothetical protein
VCQQMKPGVEASDLPVVPDRDVADARRVVNGPFEPDLQVVVVGDDPLHRARQRVCRGRLGPTHVEIVQDEVRLVPRHSQDAPGELFVHEEPFPSRYRVDADHRMHGRQVFALVERTAALAGTEIDPVRFRRLVEEARLVIGFEALEEAGKLRGETGVRLVG